MTQEKSLFVDIKKDYFAEKVVDERGKTYTTHFHNLYELYYLLEGERDYLINGKIYHAKKGSLVLIKPGVLHETFGSPFIRRLIYFNKHLLLEVFNEEYVDTLLQETDSGIYDVEGKTREFIENCFSTAQTLYDENDFKSSAINVINILNIISKHKKQDCFSHENNVIGKAVAFLSEHYSENYSLSDIAKNLYVSKFYLCHLFKKEKGVSVTKFLNKIRIEKSAELLISTNEKIKQIYINCGFNSEYYFNKCFKEQTGYTPLSYRKLFNNK